MSDISGPALDKGIAKVKELFPDAPGKLEKIICDVSKESDVAAMVEHLDSWGGVDIMFNNAGIMHADDAGKLHPTQSIKQASNNLQTPSTHRKRSGT